MEGLSRERGVAPASVAHYTAGISEELEQEKRRQTGHGHLWDTQLAAMARGESTVGEKGSAPEMGCFAGCDDKKFRLVGVGCQKVWILVVARPLVSYVTLATSRSLSRPHFTPL